MAIRAVTNSPWKPTEDGHWIGDSTKELAKLIENRQAICDAVNLVASFDPSGDGVPIIPWVDSGQEFFMEQRNEWVIARVHSRVGQHLKVITKRGSQLAQPKDLFAERPGC